MRLRTKLVLTATGLTFAIVFVLSVVFVSELLRQRVEQTSAANEVLAHEVWLATRQAVESGLRAHPPPVMPTQDATDEALHAAVIDALRSNDALMSAMEGIVRYSPTVQDVSVTDAHGLVIVSTDPDSVNQRAVYRDSFTRVKNGSVFYQMREVFGKPRVLDITEPLQRNRMPFLVVHVGVRSTFLRFAGPNAYEPWLRAALEFVLLAIVASVAAAALLSTVALRPLVTISEQLEQLTLPGREEPEGRLIDMSPLQLRGPKSVDPVGRVARTIDRLGRQIRSQEEGYTALQANLNQMLDTLRDGVLLFAADGRAVMISDAVAHFLEGTEDGAASPAVDEMIGMKIEQIFQPGSTLGAAVLTAFERGAQISAETVTLEDGRQVQISLDRIGPGRNGATQVMGTLITLRNTGTAIELEQELEVARRLAAIGRLTANVGHEVKNPINAMVVHLELLRSKLAAGPLERESAQKHVDILADEMHRLDRVVETLADFSRPMDLDLREQDLRRVVEQTLELAGAELEEHSVEIATSMPAVPLLVRIDGELMRQALLNLLLNAMQAMPSGGMVRIAVRREPRMAVLEIADNGSGIPASLLPRIFDLYFTTKPKGSGIGLAMTYRILQLHGGTMEVRSDSEPESPNRGTTFTLRVPLSMGPGSDGRRASAPLADGASRIDGSSSNAARANATSIAKGEFLREGHHSVLCLRACLTAAMLLVLIGGLAGCRHKTIRYVLPLGVLAPVDLEPAPAPTVEIASVPPPKLEPLPPPPPPAKPPRKRRQAVPKEEAPAPPTQVASVQEPATLAIGALSNGDAPPQDIQQARDLIASILKRIAALPAQTVNGQKKQLVQVRRFLDQAQKALDSSDAEGAINLATKAKLLMDDLDKK